MPAYFLAQGLAASSRRSRARAARRWWSCPTLCSWTTTRQSWASTWRQWGTWWVRRRAPGRTGRVNRAGGGGGGVVRGGCTRARGGRWAGEGVGSALATAWTPAVARNKGSERRRGRSAGRCTSAHAKAGTASGMRWLPCRARRCARPPARWPTWWPRSMPHHWCRTPEDRPLALRRTSTASCGPLSLQACSPPFLLACPQKS